MAQNKKKEKISNVPILIQSNGRVYLGCVILSQRQEISICEAKACRKRRTCQAYQQAKEIQEEWKDMYGHLFLHSQSSNTPKKNRRRRKKKKEDPPVETSIKPRRRRKKKEKPPEESFTETKKNRRRRKKKTEVEETKKSRRRRRKK